MSESLNCKNIQGQFALLLYGELSFDEEERIESHLDGCTECRMPSRRAFQRGPVTGSACVYPARAARG